MLLRDELNRWFKPWRDRLFNMVKRGVVNSVQESHPLQRIQVNLGNSDIQSNVERVQNFGLTSYPKKSAQAVTLYVNGNRDNPIIIAIDDGAYRVRVAEGEVALYNAFGVVIKLAADGTMELGTGDNLLATAGVVTGECIDTFTGAPFQDKSLLVKAQKT